MNAIVTGGCSGLGLYFTKELLNRGYKVYALYNTSVDNALELENTYDNIRCIKCDITNESDVDKVFFNIDDIDILINNAGIAKDSTIEEKTKKDFMKVLETNIFGTFVVTKYALNKLNNNGKIVNISSNNALDNYNPLSIDYDVSKAGVNMLTKDFSCLLDKQKIFSICPGWINTDSIKKMNQEFLKKEMEKVKQDKLIEPENLVKYILDNINTFNNGDIIEVKEI